jgi:hypothetical protein
MFTKKSSDFLFARPSFLSGAARVIDLGGTFDAYNTNDDPDLLAMESDWSVVGKDIEEAIRRHEDELEQVG